MILAELESYRTIIWDWNGTLLDDLHISHSAISRLLNEENLPPISVQDYQRLFCMPIQTYYQRLGFDFSRTPFTELADRWMKIYLENAHLGEVFEGSEEILEALLARGCQNFVLSAAPQTHLEDVIEKLGLQKFFRGIYGLGDHYAHSKVERGLQLLDQHIVEKSTTIMVGDTDHDAEVAQAMGIDCLLIADGHQAFEILEASGHRSLPSRFLQSDSRVS